jgi:hypothetical protein
MVEQKEEKNGKQFLIKRLSKHVEQETVFDNYMEAEIYANSQIIAHVILAKDFSLWMTQKEITEKVLLAHREFIRSIPEDLTNKGVLHASK